MPTLYVAQQLLAVLGYSLSMWEGYVKNQLNV